MHSLMNHLFPTFIFLFYLIIFLVLSRTVFRFKLKLNRSAQETATGIVGSIGSLYSIFLGFIVYILWSNYQKTYEFVTTEAAQLYIIAESSRAFPPEIQKNIRESLSAYISSILNEDIVAMSRGEEAQATQRAGEEIFKVLLQYHPKASVSTFYHSAVFALNKALETRTFRVNMLKTAIPLAWYIIIFLGAFFIIGIYSLESSLQGHPFLYILCIFLAIYMTAITVLSFPFSGYVKILDMPFHRVYKAIYNLPPESGNVISGKSVKNIKWDANYF
ncbi:DUF4239 domain-containing protein [Fluoribacter dumoffii]|uniref:bestrophin-like domain n=1 Tax=Fluoribacter dumoffii TaxID=463 RepID=UPI00224332FF|nr:DUF4239 domain-containing protein [Fluoribacter dumoffii]MCW8386498.1 DUF4239 domain-containing protein [Fluoribacter dumoffii]MCW8498228.1 DUF4239 domain-containing protein [Fluoribacter dumoffii]